MTTRSRRLDRLRKAQRRREAYTPSGVIGMVVLVVLCVAGSAFCAWTIYSTFVVEGTGLFDNVTRARAPVPAIIAAVVALAGVYGFGRIAAQGIGWLYRIANGQVPRATEDQARGRRWRPGGR